MKLLKITIINCLLVISVCLTSLAQAATVEELVQGLGKGNFTKKAKIVEEIASTGNDRAVFILNALMEGDLYYQKSDKAVFLLEEQGGNLKALEPVSGAVVADANKSDFKKIRINNKVRGAIKAGLGRLNLAHPDPARRITAANEVFRNADPEMLPILLSLIEEEADDSVRVAFQSAAAAIQLTKAEELDDRIQAVDILVETGGSDVKALFSRTLLQMEDVTTPDAKALKDAIEDGLASVERQLETFGMVENLFQGLSLGSVLLLAAIGLAITFGVMGVINMAHGEMVMLGAYTTYVIQETCRLYIPGFLDYSLIVAIPMAFVVSGIFGIALERSVIRFLYGRPLETLLATWGVSLILQQFVRTIFGPTNKEVSTPSWLSGAWEITSGLTLTYNRMAIIIFSLIVLFFLMLVLKRTLFGLQMRAVTQNRMMANSMGIRSAKVDAMTFGLGSGVAGMAGVALSQIDNVSPNLGQAYIIDSFMVVVFGGVGNLWGTLVGAGSLGIVNKFLEPYSGAVLAKIFVLVAIILFIQKRPRGLFALKGRSVEG
ncbi:urea ABC transporter permease subunit UrtB [Sneathiella limimaris]|uniref:urea ABC transporter permease subunit UrtB n=1 Tax=Sneathiella limimaris TaxID=1964213 RepID=UPI00146C84D0|nr:urea ABC transporter permease subunit UrtB [Sneathiella limimaris]